MKERSFSDGLVSVIIPSFNSMSGNERIDRLLSSIMTQTYRNFEIIVVDNFSLDGVREFCEKFPVRFFQLRSTISEARNLGLEKARGEFLIFLDSDQVIHPKLFEECVSLAKIEGADCVLIEIDCISSEPRKQKSLIDCAAMHDLEVRAGIGTTGTKLPLFYSSRVAGAERFPQKVQLGEDFVFASRVIRKKPKIAKANLRILHCEDSTIRGVVVRSWHYGGAFVTLQGDSSEAFTFLSNISIFDFGTLQRLLSLLSQRPKVIFPFAFYLLLKYAAFGLGFLRTKLFSR